jgi:hypothetical protein
VVAIPSIVANESVISLVLRFPGIRDYWLVTRATASVEA